MIITATSQLVPVLLNAIPSLEIAIGVFFEFKIPEETFYDYQDGPTRSLSLSLLTNQQVTSNCLLACIGYRQATL